MKILYVTPVFEQGGTETYIVNLGKYFKNYGEDVTVFSGGGIRQGDIIKASLKSIVSNNIRKKSIKCFLESIKELKKIILKEKFNVIHSSSIYTMIICKIAVILSRQKNIKLVYTMHGGPNKSVEKTSKYILNNFTDSLIVLSEETKKELVRNGVNARKISVIYNGIEFKNNSFINHSIKEKYNLPLIVSTGRLTEQKGYKYLIEAVDKIKDKKFKLLIIGDGELREELEKQIEELNIKNKVDLLGFKNNINDYLDIADIFVLPSLWEQFPISILEAMSKKLPIIASRVNGVPEEIGDSGILVEPKDVEDLANNIRLLLDSEEDRLKLGEAAFDKFISNFTLEHMGKETQKIYYK